MGIAGADHLEAHRLRRAALPVIDIAPLWDGGAVRVADELRAACLDKGFFYVVGHGVPDSLIEAVFAQSRRLFDLAPDEKLALDKAKSPANRGYERMRGQTLEPGAPADLKEGFYIGRELAADDPRAGGFNQGPNQWPLGLPGFRETMEAYMAAMLGIADRLIEALALSLDAAPAFAPFRRDPLTTLRLLHYPPQPVAAAPGEKGAGAHTDFGALTLLLQDEAGGLQVFDRASDGWIHADPIPGALVVNLGDMIARWTNDRYRSTRHRVVNTSARERYSIPYFYLGDPDCEVACLPSCLGPGETPRYAPTTAETHLREMYRRTYG